MAKLVNWDSIALDWQPGSGTMARSWPRHQHAVTVTVADGFATGCMCWLGGGGGCLPAASVGGCGCGVLLSICYRCMLAAWTAACPPACPCRQPTYNVFCRRGTGSRHAVYLVVVILVAVAASHARAQDVAR